MIHYDRANPGGSGQIGVMQSRSRVIARTVGWQVGCRASGGSPPGQVMRTLGLALPALLFWCPARPRTMGAPLTHQLLIFFSQLAGSIVAKTQDVYLLRSGGNTSSVHYKIHGAATCALLCSAAAGRHLSQRASRSSDEHTKTKYISVGRAPVMFAALTFRGSAECGTLGSHRTQPSCSRTTPLTSWPAAVMLALKASRVSAIAKCSYLLYFIFYSLIYLSAN